MKWQELEARHRQEQKEFFELNQNTWDALQAEKDLVLKSYENRRVPKAIKEMLATKHQLWMEEWGILGRHHMAMKERQQKEVDEYFKKDAVKLRQFSFLKLGRERGR